MKKSFALILLLSSAMLWAANTITLVPAADVHTGGAAGTINGGDLDVSAMADGSMVVFDVVITGLDFTLAGFEFQIDYPVNLLKLSETDSDWNTGTGAVFKSSGLTATGGTQFLPANADGTLNASTVVNGDGKVRIGMIWTNAGNRPSGTTTAVDGTLGRISFILDGRANCTSSTESVRVLLTNTDPSVDPNADIFADDTATRVVVDTSAASSSILEPGILLRADGENDGDRDGLDLLFTAYCSVFGKADVTCSSAYNWSAETDAVFNQVFDYDCSGTVNGLDLLGNALLCVGQGNRPLGKNAAEVGLDQKRGLMVMGFGDEIGPMGYVSLGHQGVVFGKPQISKKASENGWSLFYSYESKNLNIGLVNMEGRNEQIPNVTITYTAKGETPSISLWQSYVADPDLKTKQVDLQLQEKPVIDKPGNVDRQYEK